MSRFRPFGNPTLLAFLVAGGITAGLAYMVLAAGSSLIPDRPDPVGTAIAAPTEQAMVTVEPTQPATQSLTPTPNTGDEQALLITDNEPADPPDNPPPTSVPTRPAVTPSPSPEPTRTGPTPTPRVVNVVPPTRSPDQAPTEVPTQQALTFPTAEAAEPVETPVPTEVPTEAPPAVAAIPTTSPDVIAAPTASVEIIQLPPVDQAPQEVAQAPPPTSVPVETQPVAESADESGSTSGNSAPQSDGNAPGATTLLFPTVVPGAPDRADNANGPGNSGPATNIPGIAGNPGNSGSSGNPGGSSSPGNSGTGSAPAVIDQPTQVARDNQPESAREIADDITSRTRERTDEMRECIEDQARNRNRDRDRGRNRDRENRGENRDRNQGRNGRASCGDLVPNPDGNSVASTNPASGDLGQQIQNEVNDRLKAAGIDPDD